MLTVSYTAGEHLDLMLSEANADDNAAVRLVLEVQGFSLRIDIARPGDTTFYHEGEVVLVIDRQTSESLTNKKLDIKVTGKKYGLILIEQLEE